MGVLEALGAAADAGGHGKGGRGQVPRWPPCSDASCRLAAARSCYSDVDPARACTTCRRPAVRWRGGHGRPPACSSSTSNRADCSRPRPREAQRWGCWFAGALEPGPPAFTEGAPGLKETAVFGRALRLIEGHVPRGMARPDVVILDAPSDRPLVAWLGRAAADLGRDPQRSDRAHGVRHRRVSWPIAGLRGRGGDHPEEMPVQEMPGADRSASTALQRTAGSGRGQLRLPTARGRVGRRRPVGALWAHRRPFNDRELGRLGERWRDQPPSCRCSRSSPTGRLVVALTGQLENCPRDAVMNPRDFPLVIVVGSGGVGRPLSPLRSG